MTNQDRAAGFLGRAAAAAEGRRRAAEAAEIAAPDTEQQAAAASDAATAEAGRDFLDACMPAGIDVRRELADEFLERYMP
jgi:hypothetical protein